MKDGGDSSVARELAPLAASLCATAIQGRIIHVNTEVTGDLQTVQEAIADASDMDKVILRPGTYLRGENRDIDFQSKAVTASSVDVYDPNVLGRSTSAYGGSGILIEESRPQRVGQATG
jgi:hypothetical protein